MNLRSSDFCVIDLGRELCKVSACTVGETLRLAPTCPKSSLHQHVRNGLHCDRGTETILNMDTEIPCMQTSEMSSQKVLFFERRSAD